MNSLRIYSQARTIFCLKSFGYVLGTSWVAHSKEQGQGDGYQEKTKCNFDNGKGRKDGSLNQDST